MWRVIYGFCVGTITAVQVSTRLAKWPERDSPVRPENRNCWAAKVDISRSFPVFAKCMLLGGFPLAALYYLSYTSPYPLSVALFAGSFPNTTLLIFIVRDMYKYFIEGKQFIYGMPFLHGELESMHEAMADGNIPFISLALAVVGGLAATVFYSVTKFLF